uniref:Uncharacterized protein n=1 Tax=Rhizophora mucronata TaxID=61149 RepID=A0A2P2QY61_RHIMU
MMVICLCWFIFYGITAVSWCASPRLII